MTLVFINQEYYIVQTLSDQLLADIRELNYWNFVFYFVQYIVLLEYAVSIMILSSSLYHVVNNIYTLIFYNDRQYVLILLYQM